MSPENLNGLVINFLSKRGIHYFPYSNNKYSVTNNFALTASMHGLYLVIKKTSHLWLHEPYIGRW